MIECERAGGRVWRPFRPSPQRLSYPEESVMADRKHTKRARKITDEIVDEMWALYQTGASLKQLASSYGFTPGGIKYTFALAGLKTRTLKEAAIFGAPKRSGPCYAKRKLAPDVVKRMAEDYALGMSLQMIAEQYGFTASGIWGAFVRDGIRVRTPKEVGAIHGPKRAGNNHWTKRNPPPIKAKTYKSVRVVDEDGRIHKRRLHVVKVEKVIGRRLTRYECVHHINGDRHDNSIENLKLMLRSDHARMEIKLARQKHPEKFIRKIDKTSGRFLKQNCEVD